MNMKILLTTVAAAVLLTACANEQQTALWQARQAAINGLPPSQRAAAQIELMRDMQAQNELDRQRRDQAWTAVGLGMQQLGHDLNQPGTAWNPYRVQVQHNGTINHNVNVYGYGY
jgi:hypothetical protein